MKWKDLSLKERKQIYDSVRANNPDATYFDIKEQFDSIPEYEDGKAGYTPEERAWVARRTVELGMEGKPAPQDSLYTIVDRAKVQNKPKKYDPTDSAIEQGKQVLSGLNKTVGTALTGASLATMGLWNAARLLNVGTGSSWRLWAAKNALTGANAGLAADVGNFIEDPSITNAVQVGLSKVGSKDLTTTSNKIVNTISSGFDFDDLTKVPAYQDGKGKTINQDMANNRVHNADATNNYMEYLLDRDNIMSYNEIRQSLMDVNPNTYRYLTTPSENKAHMIQLKRGMQKEGLINNWTDPITQDKIEEYLSYRSKYANRVNPVLRTLYDIRPDKQGFINRMNNLTPIEWAVPLGLPMFFGEEQENK